MNSNFYNAEGVVPFLGVSRDPNTYDGDILVFQLCGRSLMSFVNQWDIARVCKVGMQMVIKVFYKVFVCGH